jgi:hypothetical protein
MFFLFCLTNTELAKGQVSRSALLQERGNAMNFCKVVTSKTIWLGIAGLAAMLLSGATPCKAQEVNPAQFSDKGVEDAYPAKKSAPKKATKVLTATHPANATSSQTAASKRKNHPPARKPKVASAPSI